MISHLQPQGLEGSCRHHLPKQPTPSPCHDAQGASPPPQHPLATQTTAPHIRALSRAQHLGKDLTSAAGVILAPLNHRISWVLACLQQQRCAWS